MINYVENVTLLLETKVTKSAEPNECPPSTIILQIATDIIRFRLHKITTEYR